MYYISSNKFNIQERQTKKNGRVYDVVFRITTQDGYSKQKKLSGYKTKTLAKEAYNDFVSKNCKFVKNNPLKKINTDKAVPTVKELVPVYLSTLFNGQNKESTIYDKTKLLDMYVLPTLGDIKITALTKDVLYEWQDKLWTQKNPRTNEYYSYRYLTKIRSRLTTFLSWCTDRYDYTFPDIKKPKMRVPQRKMDFWTKDEFEKFIKVVDNPMYHCIFTLMFFSGRRKGEIFALTPSDIKGDSIMFDKSLTRKTVDGSPYKITSTKTGKVQLIPICGRIQKELKNYGTDSPFLFGGEKPISENTLRRVFNNYCKKADVKQIRIHDLRHSFVSMLIHMGANLMVVAELIGDTVEQVTKTYAHMYDEDKMSIIKKLG